MRIQGPFVLASGSPRRRKLLAELGFSFQVVPSDVPEDAPPGVAPERLVRHLAEAKATAVSRQHPEALTLAADTVVVHDGLLLGKPTDAADARAMLRRLSDATHTVYTGLSLLHPPSRRAVTAYEQTTVTFAALSDEEIDAYVATGAPMDKAGAYGIQEDLGAVFVTGISGDFYTVMGLPVHRLYRMLSGHFADLFTL